MSGHRLVFLFGLALLVLVLGPACKDEFYESPDGGVITEAGIIWPETSTGTACVAGQDQDKDGIPDEIEGCKGDTDGDNLPDYNDPDADGDKVPDSKEAGSNPKQPWDSDGDKTPDYKETDSDGDGVKDGDEDLNADGKVGCCLDTCGEKRTGCPDVKSDECGKGQTCQAGTCTPKVTFLCGNGESDPKKKLTFPEGSKTDDQLPTFVCHKAGEQGQGGLKSMSFKTSTAGQWKVAIENSAVYGDISIAGADSLEAGASIEVRKDEKGSPVDVAGFVLSMKALSTDPTQAVTQLVSKLQSLPGKSAISLLSSGTPKVSHDNFQAVVSTQVSIQVTGATTPYALRNKMYQAFFGKTISKLPDESGPSQTTFRLRFETLLRSDGRMIVMGGLATDQMVTDTKIKTDIFLDDLSNGTGLATTTNSDMVECDPFLLSGTPVADIIWVVDESGSMSDNRQDVANNAKDFFSRAVSSGLDFRIAVTGVSKGSSYGYYPGKFCSSTSTDSYDSGGTDRFLTSSEQNIFSICAYNPPGYEGGSEYGLINAKAAMEKHLPRAANDPTKIRTNAQVVVIIATDELPNEIYSVGSFSSTLCQLSAADQNKVNSWIKSEYLDYFQGNDPTRGAEAKAIVHMIGGVCGNTCSAYVGHGYNELVTGTKGTTADVCQKNLGSSMQIMIDSITAASSPAKLQYVPISASLAVAVDKTQLQRSRNSGFDYSAGSNSLVFIGVPFPKGSQVVASYRRWVAQQSIE